jgi:4a-hydroxytetrahydrobiopterin dehydratase
MVLNLVIRAGVLLDHQCSTGVTMPVLSSSVIEEKLHERSGWSLVNGQIQRVFVTDGFHAAIALVVQAAMFAEVADHHPDIDIRYNKVTFTLSTHSEGGITEKDFDLAAKIDGAFDR